MFKQKKFPFCSKSCVYDGKLNGQHETLMD